MSEWIDYLQRLVQLVEDKIAIARTEAGAFDTKNYVAWNQRNAAAEMRLLEYFRTEHDARVTRPGADYGVKMAGLRASSTGGYIAALNNWKHAAERKIAAADKAAGVLAS